jgi:Protein of unknown function (DUF1064)
VNKYRNVKKKIDGITFDSIRESNFYVHLKQLEKQGDIKDLELQPEFPCVVNNKKICIYRADFQYYDIKEGQRIVLDVKGIRTRVYRLKKKLVEALYGISITEG